MVKQQKLTGNVVTRYEAGHSGSICYAARANQDAQKSTIRMLNIKRRRITGGNSPFFVRVEGWVHRRGALIEEVLARKFGVLPSGEEAHREPAVASDLSEPVEVSDALE